MVWTALLLSRVQFAFTVSFIHDRPRCLAHGPRGVPPDRQQTGVVSGVVLAFEFGMNWS